MLHNRRYHAVAQKLTVLPPELVHKVFDDLPLIKILEIVCVHDAPYMDTCLLSHIHLGKIVSNPRSLATLKQYFSLYIDLCQRCQRRGTSGNPDIPFLERDAIHFVSQYQHTKSYDKILAALKAEVLPLLEAYDPYLPALARFAPKPVVGGIPELSDPAALREFWDNLDAAERNLNATKHLQLRRIARLHFEYPGTLRRRLDTSQEPRHHAEQHRIDSLEIMAKRMLRPQVLRGKFIAKAIFSEQRFPVIPYDRHLKCFLRVLEKLPLEESIPPDDLQRLHAKYPWPLEISQDIRTVLEGMAYIYPKASVEGEKYTAIIRTKYTRYSDQAFRNAAGGRQPQFLGGFGDDDETQRHMQFLLDNDNVLPLEKKEFEWIEAFLRSCRYMEEMDDAEWKPGMTVKQFWRVHAGDVTNTQISPIQNYIS